MITKYSIVLLVEGDPSDQKRIVRAFEKAGFSKSLRIVGDPQDAIAYVSGQGVFSDRSQYPLPALVLVALKLSVKSQFAFIQWFKQRQEFSQVPLLTLTSSRRYADIKKAFDAGVNSYLEKPKEFDALVSMVKNLMNYWLVLNQTNAY